MYNINGSNETKVLASPHWHQLFQRYDILLLQETRSILEDPLHVSLDASHLSFSYCDPEKHGVAGHGLAIYFKRSLSSGYRICVRSLSKYVLWMELKASYCTYIIGNVYVPLSGSEEVYTHLERDITAFHAEGAQVVCCGDCM